jgi:hypothetical protein
MLPPHLLPLQRLQHPLLLPLLPPQQALQQPQQQVIRLLPLQEPIRWLEPLLESLVTLRQQVLMQPEPTQQQPELMPLAWMLVVPWEAWAASAAQEEAAAAAGEEMIPQVELRVVKRHLEKRVGQERKSR